MKLNHLSFIIASIVGSGVLFTSCFGHKKNGEESEEMTVSVASPEIDTVTLIKTYPGILTAISKVDLVARVDGYLREQCYDAGQYVGKGTVLFRIEDTQYRDAVQEAEASLHTALATNEYDTHNYAAMKKALESDAVSQISVIEAESNMRNSEASIKNARAALETARTNLGYCTVTAPFSGHVSIATLKPGAYLSGAASPVTLATIFDDRYMIANFNIEDSEYIRMMEENKKGMGVSFDNVPISFTDTLPHKYTANLNYIAPSIDPSTGTLLLRAQINNEYGELKDGMYVTVTLPYAKLPNAILIKDKAISTDQAGKYIYVVNDSNQVIYTPVTIGEVVRDSMRVITSGLKPGSRYVTEALLKVRDGMKVKPVIQK